MESKVRQENWWEDLELSEEKKSEKEGSETKIEVTKMPETENNLTRDQNSYNRPL